jgi:hypothetical protein
MVVLASTRRDEWIAVMTDPGAEETGAPAEGLGVADASAPREGMSPYATGGVG